MLPTSSNFKYCYPMIKNKKHNINTLITIYLDSTRNQILSKLWSLLSLIVDVTKVYW